MKGFIFNHHTVYSVVSEDQRLPHPSHGGKGKGFCNVAEVVPRVLVYLAVPMFLYWHIRRCLKVFLKVALQSA